MLGGKEAGVARRPVTESLLARAEELLRTHWIQGKLVDHATGNDCLVGAVCQAGIEADAGRAIIPAYQAVVQAIRRVDRLDADPGESMPLHVERWSEVPGRRHEQILEVVSLARRLVRWRADCLVTS
jgi:hypothetical protein